MASIRITELLEYLYGPPQTTAAGQIQVYDSFYYNKQSYNQHKAKYAKSQSSMCPLLLAIHVATYRFPTTLLLEPY